MNRSKQGKSVYLRIGFWREKNGSIHIGSNEVEGFHVAVNSDPSKPNGHPTLYKRLDALLEAAKAPDSAQTALSIVEQVTGGKLKR
jgi:hypothetical protein